MFCSRSREEELARAPTSPHRGPFTLGVTRQGRIMAQPLESQINAFSGKEMGIALISKGTLETALVLDHSPALVFNKRARSGQEKCPPVTQEAAQ